MIRKGFIALLWAVFGCTAVVADQGGDLGATERYSYAMGVRLGELLKSRGVTELDSKAFASAIDDVLENRPLRLSQAEMQEAVREQQQLLAAQRAEQAKARLADEQAFLTENAARADVVTLPDGLQYRVLQRGSGERPGAEDSVRVHYQGRLRDGTVFDSSIQRGHPAEFALNGVIPGFREAIAMMQVGDRWEVYIPSALGYGEQGAGAEIGPNETLIFEIELLAVIR